MSAEQPDRIRAAARSVRFFMSELAQALQHLVGGLDRLRVQLVGALGRDHRDELLDHVDVAALDEALLERAEAALRTQAATQ